MCEFYSEAKFEDCKVPEVVKKNLQEGGYTTMTKIQSEAIPHLLEGRDVVGRAKTGSGKTLAFVLPALSLFEKWKPRDGVAVLVIAPTRELVFQTYQVATELSVGMPLTVGLAIGGSNRREEARKLVAGVGFLVGAPGRLLDHMHNSKGFKYDSTKFLVLDEADRLLSDGFEVELLSILKGLPKKRQTALFSATSSNKLEDLMKLQLKNPAFVSVKSLEPTVAGLSQGYIVVPLEKRLLLLLTYLKQHRDTKKVMVFFSTCKSVEFHQTLCEYLQLPSIAIHGRMPQNKRFKSLLEFSGREAGILLCTDVAARGLDIPEVSTIVQYDPPDDPKEYIHRVGRTARGHEGKGSGLLFLLPEELEFLSYLKAHGMNVEKYTFADKKLARGENEVKKLIETQSALYNGSRQAYKSYIFAYDSHSMKSVFDVQKIRTRACLSFGFDNPPFIDLEARTKLKRSKRPRDGPPGDPPRTKAPRR